MTAIAKKPSKTAASSAGKMRISLVQSSKDSSCEVKVRKAKGVKMVAFGSVIVEVSTPKVAEIKRNVEAGQSALARAKATIVKPGVTIRQRKGIPLFHADPKRPGKIVRELDGKRESGMFVDGKFMAG